MADAYTQQQSPSKAFLGYSGMIISIAPIKRKWTHTFANGDITLKARFNKP
jgi:hypothetical protein